MVALELEVVVILFVLSFPILALMIVMYPRQGAGGWLPYVQICKHHTMCVCK